MADRLPLPTVFSPSTARRTSEERERRAATMIQVLILHAGLAPALRCGWQGSIRRPLTVALVNAPVHLQ